MATYQAGCFVPVSWQALKPNQTAVAALQGAAANQFVLNIKEHSLNLSVLLHDVTGVKANGVRARIAGPFDCEGHVVLDVDTDEFPLGAAIRMIPGFGGLMNFGVSPVVGITVPVIIEKIHFAGATEKELMWDGDVKCNSLMGNVIYPAL